MMKARFVFVPPGGGEADYGLDFDVPAPPQNGDYISITRPDDPARTVNFIVRRTWWSLHYPGTETYKTAGSGPTGRVVDVMVECEYAKSPLSTDAHLKMCEAYANRGTPPREFDNSAY
jgi:hypothetical protein